MAVHGRMDLGQALQQASQWLQAGRTAEAGTLLERILAVAPEQPDALQLRGLLARRQGDPKGAEQWLRRSLKANPAQAHVLNNLGNVLKDTDRRAEAVAAYREAVRLKPDYADAWTNLGVALGALDRHREAEEAYGRALALTPKAPRALAGQGLSLRHLERFEEAEAMLQAAIAAAPQDVRPLNNLANLYREQGEEARAAACFEKALTLMPSGHHLRVGLAGAYYNLGRPDEAEALLTRVLQDRPADLDAHHTLTTILCSTGRGEAVAGVFEAALANAPDHKGLWEAYLGAAWLLDRFEAGLSVVDRAEAACGGHPLFSLWRARMFVSLGQAARALDHLDPALDGHEAVQGHGIALERARAHLALGEYARGAGELAPVTVADPDDYALWAHLEVLWRLAGDGRAHWLLDYDRFIRPMEVPLPRAYGGDTERFFSDLETLLLGLHISTAHPHDQTLRQGTQTYGHLFHRREPLLRAVKDAITETIEAFAAALPDDPNHPFLKHKRRPLRFSGSWSVRLFQEGFHVPHYHSEGWISSAYYVVLPPRVADAGTRDGRLHFGLPPLAVPGGAEPVREIQPRRGTLALFPSYCWHGTVPFTDNTPRMTIAFDVARRSLSD
ncbi:MAG: tetratricopeptide repeat protein [Alphaproteobacteria bacterium]